jgi:hypothetical protein
VIELSAGDRAKVDDAVRQVVAACGARLVGLALYGEAASAEYRAGRSPLALVALVGDVGPDVLHELRPVANRLRRRGVATPLVIDSDYLEHARDVFPLELLELRDRHVGLAGDATALGRIVVDTASLRRQIEAELRGKVLHLWEGYLTTRNRRRLRSLLVATVPYFLHILRGLLELRGANEKSAVARVAATVERELAVKLPVLSRLEKEYHTDRALPLAEVDSLFDGYLVEARALVRLADRS